jgi:hypothetical protein
LHGWLAERLAEDYPSLRAFGPGIPRALSEQGHILPILDGLDELPLARRPEVITALNASLVDADQLVLTCRTREYQTAITEGHKVLTAAAVIEPESLTPAQAGDYLEACLPPDPRSSWRELLGRLRAGTAEHLATVITTPLGLWLLRTVYITPRTDPRPLLNSEVARDATTMQAHLLDQLIPAVLSSRPAFRNTNDPFRPRRTWDSIKVRGWLTSLAQHLDKAETRDLLWWHLARHTFTRRTAGLASGLLVGLASGLLVGVGIGLMGGLKSGLQVGLAGGLTGGGVVGLSVGLVVGLRDQDWLIGEPAYVNLRLKHRTRMLILHLGGGLVGGLLSGLAGGLVGGLVGGLMNGLRGGLAGGMVAGLVLGLVKWVTTPSRIGWASTPRSTYKANRTLTVIQWCLAVLAIGLAAVLLLWQVTELKAVLGAVVGGALAAVLEVGLAAGLGLMPSGAWLSYMLTSCRLAAAGKLPLRLMDFLDDAHRLGLLRATGSAYQFRHAEFHDHLIRACHLRIEASEASNATDARSRIKKIYDGP